MGEVLVGTIAVLFIVGVVCLLALLLDRWGAGREAHERACRSHHAFEDGGDSVLDLFRWLAYLIVEMGRTTVQGCAWLMNQALEDRHEAHPGPRDRDKPMEQVHTPDRERGRKPGRDFPTAIARDKRRGGRRHR